MTRRRFGVELEVFFRPNYNERTLENEMTEAGIRTVREGYHHDTNGSNLDTWKIKPDGSLSSSAGTGTAEIVSPVLTGEQGLILLAQVMAIINRQCDVNRSCGMHVHHEAVDFTDTAFRNLFRLYNRAKKDYIDYFVPRSRRDGGYCRNMRNLEDYDNRTDSDHQFKRYATEMSDRVNAVNFTSYPLRGTIEFRQHNGTTNFLKAKNWILFTQKLMEKSASSNRVTKNIPTKLGNFWLGVGMIGETTEDYVFARRYLSSRWEHFRRREGIA